jgi:WD40 repeat protein
MSTWKDSSDFASLAAALSQAKKLSKSPIKAVPETKEVKKKFENVNIKVSVTEKEPAEVCEVTENYSTYKDFPAELIDLPLKNSVNFKQHKSNVSALEFEASGSRFLSGSHDFTVAYWDFNGMVKDQPEPFRFIEPMGSYTVNHKPRLYHNN